MKNTEARKLYIDNLKTFLVTLVVLLHIAVTYGPIGFWYYYERTGLLSTYLLGFFVSFNQAFLLGLFFMISAYFIIPSYAKRGADLFIRNIKEIEPMFGYYINWNDSFSSFLV